MKDRGPDDRGNESLVYQICVKLGETEATREVSFRVELGANRGESFVGCADQRCVFIQHHVHGNIGK